MSVNQGHFKTKDAATGKWKNMKIDGTQAATDEENILLSVYDIRLRPPYADIVRFSTTNYSANDDWAKYRKRHHLVPSTTFTYDMNTPSNKRDEKYCFEACHGDYSSSYDTFFNKLKIDASNTELACFLMIPGCSKYVGNYFNYNLAGMQQLTEGIQKLEISSDCTDIIDPFNRSWLWVIVGLWTFIFLGNLYLRYKENEHCNILITCIILGAASIAVVVMTTWYAVDIDRLVHVEDFNKTTTASATFQQGSCYGSYYTNALGYTNKTQNDISFTFADDYYTKDQRKPRPAHKQPFRRGPRQWYMIFAALVGFVHVVVYAVIGCTRSKGGGFASSNFDAMQHLSSTLF